jgi:carbamate kinase
MRLVVALGGNALLRRAQAPTAAHQLANVRKAATQLARLAGEHDLLLTHGNGPQAICWSRSSPTACPRRAPWPR